MERAKDKDPQAVETVLNYLGEWLKHGNKETRADHASIEAKRLSMIALAYCKAEQVEEFDEVQASYIKGLENGN